MSPKAPQSVATPGVISTWLANAKLARPEQLIGCTEADIKTVETAFGGTLPQAYQQFLLECGRGAGQFMANTNLFYPMMLEGPTHAKSIMKE